MRDKEEREGEGASVKVQKRRSGGKKNRGKEGLTGRDVKEERRGRGGVLKKKEKGG